MYTAFDIARLLRAQGDTFSYQLTDHFPTPDATGGALHKTFRYVLQLLTSHLKPIRSNIQLEVEQGVYGFLRKNQDRKHD